MAAPPTADELKALAHGRLQEAKALAALGHHASAWYLAGYAVELALKAIVCRSLGLADYPDTLFRGALKSHDFRDLLILSGLAKEFGARSQDALFLRYWELVVTWNVQDRYRVVRTAQEVQDYFTALEDTEHGVYVWLSNRW